MNNIYLTGMPGSGKTTLAQGAAEKTNMKFVDLDALVEEKYCGSINEIFAEHGEAYFRGLEKAALKEAAAASGLFVATGGGIVLDPENVNIMQQSGTIIFIDRPLSNLLLDIETEKRPLLKEGREALVKLYEKRYEIYKSTADKIIINDGGTQEALDKLLTLLI